VSDLKPSVSHLEGLDAKGAMALANRWYRQKQTAVRTNVTTESVNFEFPDGRKRTIPLPEDQVVVAVAPYVDRTHPCEIHFMSGCQGELVGQDLKMTATSTNGEVLLDGTVRTMYNGFVELWLPRDLEITLKVGYQGKEAEGLIRTYSGSNTCVTTLQLM
jgi:hypothetical protein